MNSRTSGREDGGPCVCPVSFHHVEVPVGRSLTHRKGQQGVREVSQSQEDAVWSTDYLTLLLFGQSWCDKLCPSAALRRLNPHYVTWVWVCVCVCVHECVRACGCPLCDYWKAADICSVSINPDSQQWNQHTGSKVRMFQSALNSVVILKKLIWGSIWR